MPFTYRYNADSNLVETQATGVVTLSDALDYVSSVLADESIAAEFIEVVDFEHVEDLVLRYTELEPFKLVWRRYIEKGLLATIFYTPSDFSFGTLRMMQTVVQLGNEDTGERFIVVRSREDILVEITKLRA